MWPQTNTEGIDEEDKKVIGASSSTDFFQYLFNLDVTNPKDRKPFIDVDIGVLSGGGVPGMTGTTLLNKNVGWLVLQNIQSEIEDVIPVLVTRNCDFDTLSGSLQSFKGTETTQIKCGQTYSEPFGNKAWVLVRKGGATAGVKAKYSKYSVIFNHQGFDNSNLDNKPEFMSL